MIWMVIAAVAMFIIFWEILALATKEKYFPTWSRLIWWLQEVHPRAKKIVLGVTLTIMLVTMIWMVIHFWCGEDAVLCVDELLFLWEDFCTSIGVPC